MLGLFNMITLDIGNHPQISGILAEGVARILASLGAFEVFFSRVLLRYPNRIKVEGVFIGFGESNDGLISSRKTATAV